MNDKNGIKSTFLRENAFQNKKRESTFTLDQKSTVENVLTKALRIRLEKGELYKGTLIFGRCQFNRLYPHPAQLSRESRALIFILFNQISCLWECHIYALS